jgi:hypothetical protein
MLARLLADPLAVPYGSDHALLRSLEFDLPAAQSAQFLVYEGGGTWMLPGEANAPRFQLLERYVPREPAAGRAALEIFRSLVTRHALQRRQGEIVFDLNVIRPSTGEFWPCRAEYYNARIDYQPDPDGSGHGDDQDWFEGDLIELKKLAGLRFDEQRGVFTVDGKDLFQVTGLRALTPDGSPPNTDWKLLTKDHVRNGQVFKSYLFNDYGHAFPCEPDSASHDRELGFSDRFAEPAPDLTPQQVIDRRRAASNPRGETKTSSGRAARKRVSPPKRK